MKQCASRCTETQAWGPPPCQDILSCADGWQGQTAGPQGWPAPRQPLHPAGTGWGDYETTPASSLVLMHMWNWERTSVSRPCQRTTTDGLRGLLPKMPAPSSSTGVPCLFGRGSAGHRSWVQHEAMPSLHNGACRMGCVHPTTSCAPAGGQRRAIVSCPSFIRLPPSPRTQK